MALRLANKITCNIKQNFRQYFSTKPEIITATQSSTHEERQTTSENLSTKRYTICQPPVRQMYNSPPSRSETQAFIAKKNVEIQQLQPAMLPEYFKPPVDLSVGSFPKHSCKTVVGGEVGNETNAQYRRFEESKTYRSINSPLKASKLASPFPEPVKMMPSHTVSDQEKADQMLAESRVPKSSTSTKETKLLNHPFVRHYSKSVSDTVNPDKEKCKKQRKCPRHRSPNCSAPKSISCLRPPVHKRCCKTQAPYPSYSESCAEELEEKPSECKMCPWKPEDHPTFKSKGKKKYHTSSAHFQPIRKGDCEKPPTLDKKPCGWVKKEKDNKENGNKSETNKFNLPFEQDVNLDAIYLDHRKKPCKRPKVTPCGNKKTKKKSKKKKKSKPKSKSKKKKKKSKSKKKKCSWVDATRAYMLRTEQFGMDVWEPLETIELKDRKNIPCTKKLPFDKSNVHPKRKIYKNDPRCKKKKSPRNIENDCPNDGCNCLGNVYIEYSLAGKKSGKKRKQKKNKRKDHPCPKIKKGDCEIKDDTRDPCDRKGKPGTMQCPKNVWKKKKRKRPKPKKCSEVNLITQTQEIPTTSSIHF